MRALITSVFIFLAPTFLVPPELAVPHLTTKKVALTFDDGPWPGPTQRLSRLLSKHHVPATFFVVGKVARLFPDVLTNLVKEGHSIANHTWSHPDITRLSPEELRLELEETQRLIEIVTGIKTNLFRTPGSTEHYLRKKFLVPDGFELVLWDVHSLDNEGLSADQIRERVEDRVKDGDIVLFHNGIPATLKALDYLIPALKSRGFEFISVLDLVRPARLGGPTIIRG